MKASLTAAWLLALTLASPCMAIQEVVPMTITRIDGRSVDPLIALIEAAAGRSMIVDAIMVTTFGIRGVNPNPPPARYDRPYPNIKIVHDLPWGHQQEGEVWGWTEIPARAGGLCVIHLVPLGSASEAEGGGIEVLDAVSLPRLVKHESGHCHGLVHDGQQDSWREVVGTEREQIAAAARREWLQLSGQSDVSPAPARGSASPKQRRDITPNTMRSFSGDGY